MVIRGIAVDDLNIKDIFIVLKRVGCWATFAKILFVTNFIRLYIFDQKHNISISLLLAFTITISLVSANSWVEYLDCKETQMDPASASTSYNNYCRRNQFNNIFYASYSCFKNLVFDIKKCR